MATRKVPEAARLTDESSIPGVVARLTLLEKASLCGGATPFETHAVERLGIPSIVMADGHNGINIFHLIHNYIAYAVKRHGMDPAPLQGLARRVRQDGLAGFEALMKGPIAGSPLATRYAPGDPAVRALGEELRRELPAAGLPSCFPTGIVMAATWDTELVSECGRAVAMEARAFGMDILLGPNVNIHRDPLCGRAFESYSEDPYLAARIGVSYIRGVQSQGVAAVVKHYAANNQETERMGVDARISERALREIYLPAFRAAVQDGPVWVVMSAYNKVNGDACAMNRRLLTEILRAEWGFRGLVVSDWGAAYDRVAALRAGNDLEMPGPLDPKQIEAAVKSGALPEAVLDERVADILRVAIRLPSFLRRPRPPLDREHSASIARRVAAEGMVLLKNREGTLPLRGGERGGQHGGQLAVFGENARQPIPTGAGSAGVLAPYTVSLFDALTTRYGSRVVFGELPDSAEAAIVSIGSGSGEGADRAGMELAQEDTRLVVEVARRCRTAGKKCIVVLNACAPVEIADWVDDVDAVLLAWLAGMEIGNAAVDILSGEVNPSGKLPLSYPKRYRDAPTSLSFPGEFGESVYGEGIYLGYRFYDTARVEPLFPFGHGLSYTSFSLGKLELSADTLPVEGGELVVTAELRNTGSRRGKEVVQLYVRDTRSSVRKPAKELKGFAKIELEPGEAKTMSLTIDATSLAHYDPRKLRWCVEPGEFEILLGTSSRDIAARATFRAKGPNPYGYEASTPFGTLIRDERAVKVLRRHFPAAALEDPAVHDVVEYSPATPLEKVFAAHLARHLGPLTEGELSRALDRIVAELGELELREAP